MVDSPRGCRPSRAARNTGASRTPIAPAAFPDGGVTVPLTTEDTCSSCHAGGRELACPRRQKRYDTPMSMWWVLRSIWTRVLPEVSAPDAGEGLKLNSGLKWVNRYSPNTKKFWWSCHATPALAFTPMDASVSDCLFGGPKLVVSSAVATKAATPPLR